jgi:hypothetical protein
VADPTERQENRPFTVTEAGLYEITYGYRGVDGSGGRFTELVKLKGPDDPIQARGGRPMETWLTSADPEPPPGTTVLRDGEVWGRGFDDRGDGWLNWTRREPDDRESGPETWTKVSGTYGPVKVVDWGDKEWRPVTDLQEVVELLRGIDDKLSKVLDPQCRCAHRSSQHSTPPGGVCLQDCPCNVFITDVRLGP